MEIETVEKRDRNDEERRPDEMIKLGRKYLCELIFCEQKSQRTNQGSQEVD